MKPKQPNLSKFLTLGFGLAVAGISIQSAQAVTYYWDENTGTAGFGTAGTVGTNWSSTTSLFSTDINGTTNPIGTQTSGTLDTVNFGTASAGLASGTINVSNAATASNLTFGALSGAITIGGTGSLNLGTNNGITFLSNNTGNVISTTLIGGSSSQMLTIQGSATTTLTTISGTNTFNRAVTINTGKLSVTTIGSVNSTSSNLGAPTTAANATLNMLGNSTLLYTGAGETSDRVINLSSGSGSGGVLDQSGTGLLKFTGGITSTGASSKTLTLQGSTAGTGEVSGIIANNSASLVTSLTKTGSGTWTLSNANTYSGKTSITGGALSASSIGSVGGAASNLGLVTTIANGTIDMSGGGRLLYAGTGETTDRVINLASGGGTGAVLDQSGTGLLKFTSGVTSTGTSSKTLTLQGSTAGTGEISGIIADNGGANITSLAKTGSGTWTLSNTNTYSGKTSINGGALSASSIGSVNGGASNLGSATTVANGTIDMSGGGRLLYTGTGETTNRVINLVSGAGSGAFLDQSGTGLLKFTSGVTSTGTSSKTLTLQGSTAGTGEISGIIADNGGANITSLAKTGSGTWTLSNANTYSGKTSINGGALSASSIGSVNGGASNLGSVTTVANGTIDMSGSGRLLYTGTGETTDRVINLASSFGTSAVLDQSGSGNLKFTGGVTSTGASSKTLTLQGSTAGKGEISGVIADNSGANITSLAKTGSGIWTLSNANTYTGTTAVSAGVLAINGDQSAATGAVSVSNALTRLIGTGTVGGDTTINSGAIQSAGGAIANVDKIGKQTFDETGAATADLTYGAGSIFEWDLNTNKDTDGYDHDSNGGTPNTNVGTRGADYDAVDVSGTLTVSATAIFRVVLGSTVGVGAGTFWQQDQSWTDIFGGGFTPGASFTNSLLQVVDASTGLAYDQNSLNAGYGFSVSGTTLSWSAVPEPSSALAGLLISAGLLRRRRA